MINNHDIARNKLIVVETLLTIYSALPEIKTQHITLNKFIIRHTKEFIVNIIQNEISISGNSRLLFMSKLALSQW